MTQVINFYGGPGTGKSTSAAMVFSELKQAGVNCELVQEYVKQWAWEERKPVSLDQFYFFGKQSRKEYSLFGRVETIITDSPVSLCAYYCKVFGTKEQADLFIEMTKTYYSLAAKQGNDYQHVWLRRVKPYNPKGRFQNEQEARDIDVDMKDFLTNTLGLRLTEVDGSREGITDFITGVSSTTRGPV